MTPASGEIIRKRRMLGHGQTPGTPTATCVPFATQLPDGHNLQSPALTSQDRSGEGKELAAADLCLDVLEHPSLVAALRS